MIDEKKLIDALRYDLSCFETDYAKDNELYIRVDDMIRMIEGQPKEDEWIPVSERLPDTDDKIPVWVSFHEPFGGYTRKAYWNCEWETGKNCFMWENGKKIRDTLAAWKRYYAPEPYKEDN